MSIINGTPVKLISFSGTVKPKRNTKPNENYWRLIGEKGKIIDAVENDNGRILVLFEKNLDGFKLENHNPVKNTLWIMSSDLEIAQ